MLNDYQMFCVSVRGYSHIQEGTPKEDDSGMLKTEDGWIGVVSDGHGDPRCMRSTLGSRFAVETAMENLQQWLKRRDPASERPVMLSREEKQTSTGTEDNNDSGDQKVMVVPGAETESICGKHIRKENMENGKTDDSDTEPAALSAVSAPEDSVERTDVKPAIPAPAPATQSIPDRTDPVQEIHVSVQSSEVPQEDPWSDACIRKLCRRIALQWQERTEAHYRENPLNEDEIKAAGNLYPSYAAGTRIPHIYGATLLAAVMTDDRILLIQKGDGHAIFIYEDGTTSHEVIPWDDRCELNFTTSLCDTDAADTFHWAIVNLWDKPGAVAIMLASDGLEDCFANMDAAEVFVGQTAVFGAREGMENLENYLLSELAGMSERASRDDISVVGWINPPAVLPLRHRFDLLAEYYRAQNRLKEAKLHIGSMAGSKQRMEERMKKMEAELSRLKGVEKDLEEKGRALTEQQADSQARIGGNPFMRGLHSLISELRLSDADFLAQTRTYRSIRDTLSRDQQESSQIDGQRESNQRELQALQTEYDELSGKYSSYAERYQQWADQQRDAENTLARISGDLAAPAEAEEEEPEDAEDAFRRMMED